VLPWLEHFQTIPEILFADEPTGNLDDETGEKVIQLLFELNEQAGTTLVIITHDLDLANRTQQILRLKGGRIMTNEKTRS
jgi:putative ABC transport system ATP-binding protein